MSKSFSYQQILTQQLVIPKHLLTNYMSLGLNETEVMTILQIHRFQNENNNFPTPDELASFLTINEKECSSILRRLIQKGFLAIEQTHNEQQQLSERYSLNPLWEKLFTPKSKTEENMPEGTLFILFEQEFGRPLSPFEIETINAWLDEDKIMPSLIKAALRESVLMGKLNFKYMDRILRDWKQRGIHTVEEARIHSKSFRENKITKTQEAPKEKRDTSFYYNWLEGEE